jgi:hypothetical protein
VAALDLQVVAGGVVEPSFVADDHLLAELAIDGDVIGLVVHADAVLDDLSEDKLGPGLAALMSEGAGEEGGKDAEAAGELVAALVTAKGVLDMAEGEVDEAADAGGGGVGVEGDAAVVLGDELGVLAAPAGEGATIDAESFGDGGEGVAGEEEVHGVVLDGGEREHVIGFVVLVDGACAGGGPEVVVAGLGLLLGIIGVETAAGGRDFIDVPFGARMGRRVSALVGWG